MLLNINHTNRAKFGLHFIFLCFSPPPHKNIERKAVHKTTEDRIL